MSNIYNCVYEFYIARESSFAVTAKSFSYGDCKWNWNVYAYIFDNHPLYNDVQKAMELPFNCGVTYDKIRKTSPAQGIRYDFEEETNTLILGSDYAHIYDDYDNHPSPSKGVPVYVESDALHLVSALKKACNE